MLNVNLNIIRVIHLIYDHENNVKEPNHYTINLFIILHIITISSDIDKQEWI